MQEDPIVLSITSNVATIILNRPNSLNAFTLQAVTDLSKHLRKCEETSSVSVVVIRGAGQKAFSAGADIHIFDSFKNESDANNFWKITAPEVHRFIEKMTKPVISVVSGYCLGGGLEIALACDLVIATDDSKFAFPEVNLGLIPGWGGTQRISRIVGRHKAKQLVFLGEMIDADEAYRLGIVNWVVKRDQLASFVNELTAKLIMKSPITIGRAKEAINNAYELKLDEGLSLETELDTILMSTEDTKEGIRAFLEKRKPLFKGK